eukprot:TRINITY_DN9006_c0_g1_i1.p1 TRINITY_DN9006_c0_g1~~TRINITY_DN9006_c0_g1_i1.p1  ORF type:complete len:161 (-),score=19.55 TRINITY_DN9006_c0_g1_i1:84-566(-)
MEFPDLGRHCGLSTCKQLDFLPFKCAGCSIHFCADHRNDHKCATPCVVISAPASTISCVVCEKVLLVKKGEDVNQVMDKHLSLNQCSVSKQRVVNKYKCSKCNKYGMTSVTCKDCGLEFCLTHRFNKDHACKMNLKRSMSRLVGPFIVDDSKRPIISVRS